MTGSLRCNNKFKLINNGSAPLSKHSYNSCISLLNDVISLFNRVSFFHHLSFLDFGTRSSFLKMHTALKFSQCNWSNQASVLNEI